MNGPIKTGLPIGWGPEGSWTQVLLSPNWGAPPFWHMGGFTSQKLSKLHGLRVFIKVSSHKHAQLWTQSPAPLCSPEDKEWTWKFQTFILTGFFWRSVPILKQSRGSQTPAMSSTNKKKLITPKSSKVLDALVLGTRVKNRILEQEMFLVPLSLRKLQGF